MFSKILLTILVLLFSTSVNAKNFQEINYKNLKNGAKVAIENGLWTTKYNKKISNYYIKKVPEGTTNYTEFYSSQGEFLFSTATQYEFINKGSLIGYSNSDLKFYEFEIKNNLIEQKELTYQEVQELFPKYNIIKISDFSPNTNCYKVKKKRSDLKIILLNDTDRYFYNYGFTTNNSKFKTYALKGFLDINQKGMVQFSSFGENTKNKPWYILLVR